MFPARTGLSQSPKVNARLEELVRIKKEVVVPARLEPQPRHKMFAWLAERGAMASLLVVLSLLPLGCAHEGHFTWAEDMPLKDAAAEPMVHPRDSILVEVAKQPTLSGEFVVRDDGHYAQPMVGSIRVADQTPRQIATAVALALKNVVVAPMVSVWVTKTSPIRVSVVGEVKAPGNYEMTRDRNLLTVLAQAGWLTEFAHNDRVYVVRAGGNERIRFRVRDITTAEPFVAQFMLADADTVVVE